MFIHIYIYIYFHISTTYIFTNIQLPQYPFYLFYHFIPFPISNNQLPDFQLDRGTTFRQRLQLGIHQGHIHRRSRRQIFLEAVQRTKPLRGFPRTRCLAIFGSSGNSKTLWVFWGMKFKLVFFSDSSAFWVFVLEVCWKSQQGGDTSIAFNSGMLSCWNMRGQSTIVQD